MQHPDEGTIHSWLDGALSADEAARVEAHVKDCPECAAAVAEARGFIAASSRILTALDNAPRGVIPATAPKKRVDPIVWRIAATLLVVAGGTFVVLRSNSGKSTSGFTTYETPDTAPVPGFAPPITIMGNPPRAVDGSSKSSVSSADQNRAKGEAADRAPASAQRVLAGKSIGAETGSAATQAAPQIAFSGKASISPTQTKISAPGNVTDSAGALAAAPTAGVALSGAVGSTGAPIRRALTPAPAGSVAALDAASEPQALKRVGTARQIGVNTTLYEVAPGDTVTLTEIMSLQLGAVVVTGLPRAPTADKSAEKPATAQAAKSAAAVSASDSQGGAGEASPAPAQKARALTGNVLTSKTGNVQVSNGVTTISWTDPVTRNAMKLSGRMSAERLQQVKTQIERERAAEAAKKKP